METNSFQYRATELILKHLRGELNDNERKELEAWKAEFPENRQLFDELTGNETLNNDVKIMNRLKQRIAEKIFTVIPEARQTVPLFSRPLFKWVAAAAAVILIAGYWLLKVPRSAGNDKPEIATTKDVKAPDANRAKLVLDNGTIVYLDSVANGSLAVQGNINVIKTADGQIVYKESSKASPDGGGLEGAYNTLDNPRGSKVVSLTLSDGTKVWLNSESSLKYPIAFVSNERKVEITGEAYFEISKDAAKKFIVESGDIRTEVLGTHFNVNAYGDEAGIKVTLLEGSVKVANKDGSVIIRPGQQANLTSNQQPETKNDIDLEEVMAWKNGKFSFNRTDIEVIMRQVARWYDVEILYENGVKGKDFTGNMDRKENVSEVLKMLEMTGVIHFKIEDKKIRVMK